VRGSWSTNRQKKIRLSIFCLFEDIPDTSHFDGTLVHGRSVAPTFSIRWKASRRKGCGMLRRRWCSWWWNILRGLIKFIHHELILQFFLCYCHASSSLKRSLLTTSFLVSRFTTYTPLTSHHIRWSCIFHRDRPASSFWLQILELMQHTQKFLGMLQACNHSMPLEMSYSSLSLWGINWASKLHTPYLPPKAASAVSFPWAWFLSCRRWFFLFAIPFYCGM